MGEAEWTPWIRAISAPVSAASNKALWMLRFQEGGSIHLVLAKLLGYATRSDSTHLRDRFDDPNHAECLVTPRGGNIVVSRTETRCVCARRVAVSDLPVPGSLPSSTTS